MNYEEAMHYIKNTSKFGSNLGLSRTEKILEILGNPQKKIKCIHVAGTNGKGSTTAMISKVLIEAGYKVGMYTSPYIEEFEERIQINEKNIEKEDLSYVVTEVSKAINKIDIDKYGNPTEFEIITCVMFLYFYKECVDFAVIEVGLGGRLDSTNVITPIVSVITSISYDHMNILGDTLHKIAGEKAGIIKKNVPVVLYPQEEEALQVIEETCTKTNSELVKIPCHCVKLKSVEALAQHIEVKTEKDKYEIELSLLGKHQLLNCATVIYTLEKLMEQGVEIPKQYILKALREVKWHGRLEVMNKKPLIVIDGAHNIDGITKLKDSIDTYFKYNKLILILGILADKEVEKMVSTIVPMASRVITVTPHSERAEVSEELKNVVDKYNNFCEALEDYKEAYKKALSYSGQDDLLLVCGSLYMIGDMRKIITTSM